MPGNTQLSEKTDVKLKHPKQYKVLMYNDDFTPMDVVVDILIEVFHKSYEEAVMIMMTVHKGDSDSGEQPPRGHLGDSGVVVGVYTYDIAKTKAAKAVKIARDLGYPFRVEVKE